LEKFHRYPKAAHRARGEAQVSSRIDRERQILSENPVLSSGNEILDRDDVALIARRAVPGAASCARSPRRKWQL